MAGRRFEAKTIYELAADHKLGPVEAAGSSPRLARSPTFAHALDLDVGDPVILMRSRSKLANGTPLESSAFYFSSPPLFILVLVHARRRRSTVRDSGSHDFYPPMAAAV
jgi:hypothetical protein